MLYRSTGYLLGRYPVSLLTIRNYTLPANFTIGGPAKNTSQRHESFDLQSQDIADTLANDPNLANFYDSETLNSIKQLNSNLTNDHMDPFDLSYIPMNSAEQDQANNLSSTTPALDLSNGPQTMTTEDFMRLMKNEVQGTDPDVYISQVLNQSESHPHPLPSKTSITHEVKIGDIQNSSVQTSCHSKLIEFIENDDIAVFNQPLRILQPDEILNTELPLVVISKFTDPRLNLSIEKYIYDNYPSTKDPINRFSRRLFLYKNSGCIVLGKNQNIYREINLRLASALSIPILRRFSGGGTVVHDLGNVNFSFMCSKDDFSRTKYTSELVKSWNVMFPQNVLKINEKGDMIRSSDEKKISGSAYQISKGKSLHHGTMLLNSDLQTLRKLLKIDPHRKQSITDRATNSIPSPVINTGIDTYSFIDIATKSFVSAFGVPTSLGSIIEKQNYSNLSLVRVNNIEAQVLKLNDLNMLPFEVWETYKQLQSWNWIFGKSPRFQMSMSLENGSLNLTFDVDKGRVIGLEFDVGDSRLDKLVAALSTKEQVVNFSNFGLGKYIDDTELLQQISWNIDHSMNYKNVGILESTL